MKGLIILADGFEDTEAIMTMDILKRAKCIVKSASPNNDLKVTSSYNLSLFSDIHLNEVSEKDYDFLVIPGGRAVENVLKKNDLVKQLILSFARSKKLIAAICAAPSLLINYGLLENTEYTCFPTYENLALATLYRNQDVVVTKNIITAKAMAYTAEFALAIVEKVCSKEVAKQVLLTIRGEK